MIFTLAKSVRAILLPVQTFCRKHNHAESLSRKPFSENSCLGSEPFSTDSTVKILRIGTPEIITIIVLQLEQLDFTVQYCVQRCRQNNKQSRH